MGRAVKLAISIPEELYEDAERERHERRETRSAFFRRALEAFLRQRREHDAVERYLRGYREQPESDDEIRAAQASAARVLTQEPWE
jgi:metal-responsive CopG/Arc/MetJ family transcriptional regulator